MDNVTNLEVAEKVKFKDIIEGFKSILIGEKGKKSDNDIDEKLKVIYKEEDSNSIRHLESEINTYGSTKTKKRSTTKIETGEVQIAPKSQILEKQDDERSLDR